MGLFFDKTETPKFVIYKLNRARSLVLLVLPPLVASLALLSQTVFGALVGVLVTGTISLAVGFEMLLIRIFRIKYDHTVYPSGDIWIEKEYTESRRNI
jgi:hypothetical protein